MNMKRTAVLFLSGILICVQAFGQLDHMDSLAIVLMQKDVRYLADDKMEGREAGTRGEEMAAQYIAT